jgi:dihydrofolate reductase
VFSRSRTDVPELVNSRLATRPPAEEVAWLREQPGADMVLFGGASTVQEFVRLGLVDEYWLKVQPVAVGGGLPVFSTLPAPVDLELVWHKIYPSGVVGLRYRRAGESTMVTRSRYAS